MHKKVYRLHGFLDNALRPVNKIAEALDAPTVVTVSRSFIDPVDLVQYS